MTWTAPGPTTPPDGPLVGEDRPILEAFLAWQRATLRNLCAGLTGEQLAQRAVGSSNLSVPALRVLPVRQRLFRQESSGVNEEDP
jgi:hypothetical protein